MDTLDMLYTRSAAGLMIPRSAVMPSAPPAPPRIEHDEPVKIPRQQRRWLERKGIKNRCACGQVISMTAKQCGACAKAKEAIEARAAAAGLVLP